MTSYILRRVSHLLVTNSVTSTKAYYSSSAPREAIGKAFVSLCAAISEKIIFNYFQYSLKDY